MLLTNLKIDSSQPASAISHAWIQVTKDMLRYNFCIDDLISFSSHIIPKSKNKIEYIDNIKILYKNKDESLSFDNFLKAAVWDQKFIMPDRLLKYYYDINTKENVKLMIDSCNAIDLLEFDKRMEEVSSQFSS